MNTSRFVHPARPTTVVRDEGACALALTTPEMAKSQGWPVIAHVSVGAAGDDTVTVTPADASAANAGRWRCPSPLRPSGVAGLGDMPACALPNGCRHFAALRASRSTGVERRVAVETPVGMERGRRERNVRQGRPRSKRLPCPVAIVGMGCVVPGAPDVERYWQNIVDGVSGVVQMEKIIPDAAGLHLSRR